MNTIFLEQMTDSELLSEYAATGSEAALAQIVERHSPRVYSTCLSVLRDTAAAEDAAQSTFIVFTTKAGSLPPQTVLPGWFYTTALHTAQKLRRTEVRRNKREQAAAAMRPNTTRSQETEALAEDELHCSVADAMTALPAPQRDALTLRYVYQMTEADAAAELGVPLKTLHSRVTTGLAKLRERFSRREAPVTVAVIAALLIEQGAHAAPAGLCGHIQAVCTGELSPSPAAQQSADAVLRAPTPRAANVVLAKPQRAPAIYLAIAAAVLLFLIGGVIMFKRAGAPPVKPTLPPPAVKNDSVTTNRLQNDPASQSAISNAPAVKTSVPPKEKEGAAVTATENGLQISINATKVRFAPFEPVKFKVTYTNVSDRAFNLADFKQGIGDLMLQDLKQPALWGVKRFTGTQLVSKTLQPKESWSFEIVLADPVRFFRITPEGPGTKRVEEFMSLPASDYGLTVPVSYAASAENSTQTVPSWSGTVMVKGVPVSIGKPPAPSDGF